jgi:hypothetical protein
MLKMVETSKKSDNRLKYYEKVKSEEYRKYLSEKFKKNPTMKGNSYYKVWVKKYGKKIADNMNRECSLKKSHKGEKNYWFGKTPPFGSGNGWSGWYNGWYFRSLLELSYMVNIIEKYNIDWVSGEKNEYKIEYYHNNKEKLRRENNQWKNNNRKTDGFYRMKINLRHRLRDYLIGESRGKRTKDIVGLDKVEFKLYIQSKFVEGMSWDNYGKWHLDHIKPLCQAKDNEEALLLNHYTNLQPLWAEDNLRKNRKI